MSRPQRILLYVAAGLLAAGLLTPILLFYGARWYYDPTLPSVSSLKDLQLQVPLRVYTRDGELIGEYGTELRAPLRYEQIPQRIIDAFLAAEDDRFFEHPGVDWQGLVRATLKLAVTGEKAQGGSTITMQLARNVFLTPERSYERKIREILLALRIEREMSKPEILETYLNKIFLGQRAYGVGIASQVYFGRKPDELSWGQAALLAGLPKAPSRDNPVASPERARDRRNYVLRRLHALDKISEDDMKTAMAEPIEVAAEVQQVQADAHYVAEMVRAEMVERYGDAAYTSGFRVVTTVSSERQNAANRALRAALRGYDERHGWRGPEARMAAEALARPDRDQEIDRELAMRPAAAGLVPAVVTAFAAGKLSLQLSGAQHLDIGEKGYAWARPNGRRTLQPGDIVRIRKDGEGWRLAEIPEVQGALVALDPRDGAVQAVVGGYDFMLNKFNRAVQAQRQSGSGFKPFLYAAAFARGFSPASVLLDAPVVFEDTGLEGDWRPENYDGDFKGPMRLREALVQSRNLVSIRLLQELGVDTARQYIRQFGFDVERIPKDLSAALGTGSFSPMEMASAYAVLANGGRLVQPYLIARITDSTNQVVYAATPAVACNPCSPQLVASAATGSQTDTAPAPPNMAPQVVDPAVTWLVDSILREVTVRGTAAQARQLGRADIAGKTGTTNDETDAWFNGYNGELVAVSWVGFDQPMPLGRGEVGGRAALPMWMDFMRDALKGHPEILRPRPPGLVTVRIDSQTGLLAPGGDPGALLEVVPEGAVPESARTAQSRSAVSVDSLF